MRPPKDTKFKILYIYLMLIPLVIDIIIIYHARLSVTLKTKLLSYILLKIILLPVHESTIHLYNNKSYNQFTDLIILV